MYETELMRKILTSPMAKKMIQQITPRYGNAYVFLWLMQVIGLEWDELEKWVLEYKLQTTPITATWGLDYWEQAYNITSNPNWSYERRRNNIIVKRNSKGPMNPAKLKAIVEVASGYPARIVENTGKNHFTIYISATSFLVSEAEIRKAIDAVKPARLNYTIQYEIHLPSTMYMIGRVQRVRTVVNLRQIN